MHKTLVIDGLTYLQNIMQPSFVGLFNVVGPTNLPTMPRHNPTLEVRVSASFQKIPRLVGRLGSAVRVTVNFQTFSGGNLRWGYLRGLSHGSPPTQQRVKLAGLHGELDVHST